MKKSKLTFSAIAVAAAIDHEGTVIAEHVVDGAIDRYSFADFIEKVHNFTRGRPCVMMLDNLRVHYCHEVRSLAEKYNIEFCFNGTYSSEFMPIERLWAWSKSRFTRQCVRDAPYHS